MRERYLPLTALARLEVELVLPVSTVMTWRMLRGIWERAEIRTKVRYSRRNDPAHDHASIAAARRSPQVTSAANFWNQTGRTARHSGDPDTVAGDRVERQRVGLVRDRGVVVGVRRGGAASKCSVSIIGSRAAGASAAEP
ncbi:hypothetical protein AB0H34_39220 [Saccharopolyspora shandongensis]|uniref:hypothetical protein n=1 Tax=Saccharopolyspora shandongensis TaxID=418495 RepID=UPI0033D1726E